MSDAHETLATLPSSGDSLSKAAEARKAIMIALKNMETNDEELKRRFVSLATSTGNEIVADITLAIKRNMYGPDGKQFNRQLDGISGGVYRKWLTAAASHSVCTDEVEACRSSYSASSKAYEATDPPWAINIFATLTLIQSVAKDEMDAAKAELEKAKANLTEAKTRLRATSRDVMSSLMQNIESLTTIRGFAGVTEAVKKGNLEALDVQRQHSAAQSALLEELSTLFKGLARAYRR